MSWSTIKSRGSGKVRYALVVEGWPYIYVTDPALTLATDKGDRTVIDGLLTDGMRIQERAYPGEGRLECSGMTFKLRPPSGRKTTAGTTDPISTSLAKRGAISGYLGSALSDTALTIAMVGSSTLSNSTYYYVGTETIKTATFPTITRGNFGSHAQKHNTTYIEGSREVAVYNYPTTIDGRRVYLYIYGEGDSVLTLSSSNVIWRGIVRQPPRLDRDGTTWSLSCSHVVDAFKQPVVGAEVALKVVGLYHHAKAPIYFRVFLGSTGTSSHHYIGGFYANPGDLCDAVNDELATAVTEAGATSTNIQYIELSYNGTGYFLTARTGTSAPSQLNVFMWSPLIGGTQAFWRSGSGTSLHMISDAPANSTTYTLRLGIDDYASYGGTPWISTAGPATGLGGPIYRMFQDYLDSVPPDGHAVYDYSEWRVYLEPSWTTVTGAGNETKWGIRIDPATVVGGEFEPGMFTVSDYGTDSNGNWIELTPRFSASKQGARENSNDISRLRSSTFFGFLTGDTVLRPVANFQNSSTATDFIDFLSNLITRRVDANDGITPFLTPEDFDTTATLPVGQPDWVLDRVYSYLTPMSVQEVLSQELLLAGAMLYIDSNAKISVRSMPVFTDTTTVTDTVASGPRALTGSHIITPADGYGSWPGYELQPQGNLTSVVIKQGYDPATQEWNGTTYEFRDADLLSRNKKRVTREIAPRSAPANGAMLGQKDLELVALRLMSLMGREYAAVRIQVPFTCFGILIGDIVSITSKHIPSASDGSRGISGKRAVVMGRNWNLDPAKEEWGELEIWILLDAGIAGYAPSARITAQVNTGGNTWNLTCSTSNTDNILFSNASNGRCLENFAASDFIRVCELDGTTERTGSISGSPDALAGTCTVVLNSAWTPGTSTWTLEYGSDASGLAQTGQRAFAYIADEDKKLATGAAARLFA